MPEIVMDVNPRITYLFKEIRFIEDMKRDFEKWFTEAIEEAFGIKGKNDVEFKIISTPIIYSGENVVDIAVDINYTVGTDEYGTGRIFNPGKEQRETAIRMIREKFEIISRKYNLPCLSFSVWCKPHKNSSYKMWER